MSDPMFYLRHWAPRDEYPDENITGGDEITTDNERGPTFEIWDVVRTSRPVRAGLKEDGPLVCDAGVTGVVKAIQLREPDGILVELETGADWWMMPTQLSLIERPDRPEEEEV